MSVRLRLTRLGRKKRPYYRIVAIDSRKKRDGAFIERIGYYHPLENPPGVFIDGEKALKWLRTGAKPSETVLNLLKREGIWFRFRLEKRGLPEHQINEMMQEWFKTHNKMMPTAPITEPTTTPEQPPSTETQPAEEVPAENPDAIINQMSISNNI